MRFVTARRMLRPERLDWYRTMGAFSGGTRPGMPKATELVRKTGKRRVFAATVTGQKDHDSLKVDSITFNGRTYPVVSNVAESRGRRRGRRTLSGTGIGAGAGALIGGLAGGGAGLAAGALIGGGGGTAVAAATGKKRLTIPPESVLSFQLQSPLMPK